MVRQGAGAQRDLFALTGTTNIWPLEAKRELVAIRKKLLLEGIAEEAMVREGSDEQDHA